MIGFKVIRFRDNKVTKYFDYDSVVRALKKRNVVRYDYFVDTQIETLFITESFVVDDRFDIMEIPVIEELETIAHACITNWELSLYDRLQRMRNIYSQIIKVR